MTQPRHRIVVALDLSEYAEIVLEHALDQAARHAAPDLHFLHVAEDSVEALEAGKRGLAEQVLPALENFRCTDWSVRMHVRAGKPADEISSLAGEIDAHLIVVGRFGRHRRSVSARVIELAPCPTLVVGLFGEDNAAAKAQCPDCVEVRASSDGERWFCDAHAGDRVRLSTLVTPGSTSLGGLMW